MVPSSSTSPSPSTQGGRLRQAIEQKHRAALAGQGDAAAMAVMGVQRDLVDGRGAVPLPGRS